MFWYLSADSSVKSPKDDYLQKIKIFAVKKRWSCLASDIFLILFSNTSVLFQFENSNVNKQDIINYYNYYNLKNQKKSWFLVKSHMETSFKRLQIKRRRNATRKRILSLKMAWKIEIYFPCIDTRGKKSTIFNEIDLLFLQVNQNVTTDLTYILTYVFVSQIKFSNAHLKYLVIKPIKPQNLGSKLSKLDR